MQRGDASAGRGAAAMQGLVPNEQGTPRAALSFAGMDAKVKEAITMASHVRNACSKRVQPFTRQAVIASVLQAARFAAIIGLAFAALFGVSQRRDAGV